MEREIKRLKRSRIPLVKVRWNSRRGPEFTWEREDSFKQKYPQLFTNRASSSTTRIFISQDKYVADILKKFDFITVKTTSTPIETNKSLLKDEEAEDVDVHLYRSMIGSLMYLIASRPDIMFDVCACARLISWQCKKQTVVANSTTKAEYVVAANCCGQTATVRIVDNREQEITTTVDGKEFTINEASVRRHLQLADVEGISSLPTTEIFDQLSLMG
ncbi:hypothetical protein Tco_0944301, partial [Tanacetum coccineum]